MNMHSGQEPWALDIQQLSVNYDQTPVLWDISLQVPKNQLVGIIGPNGAGKSTLIKASLGLMKPISGRVQFFGQSLQAVRQRIAYVPQKESVDWDFPITVRDLVLMGRYGRLGLFRWPSKADKAAAGHYLELVGMSHAAKRQISQLSGGQRQRVFLARALLQEADLYFFDEPFAGVDIATEAIIMDLLRNLTTQGKTVFVVHHDLTSIQTCFDWVILLNIRLVGAGSIQSVFTAEALQVAYGKHYPFLKDILKIAQLKPAGPNDRPD
jgi:manganese/zinc/iron transport system ATP- binding protein